MSRSIARARARRDRTSLYQEITDKIIAELEASRVPWVQPWGTAAAKASLNMPKNAATHRHYSGINVLILWGAVIERGFGTQNWLTFRQALGLGGNVRKGEHGTTIVYADCFVPDEERKRAERDGDEPSAVRFLKRFAVFNTDQCEGLPQEVVSAPSPVPEGLRVPRAEGLIAATGADFRIGGDRAFYNPTYDFIQVPRPDGYFEPSTGTGPPCTSSVIGRARGKDSIVISPAASDQRSMPGRSWSPKSAAPSCVLRLTSYQRCATPTILAPGSKSCARMIALSLAPPCAASKATDYLLAFCRESNECAVGVDHPTISSSAIDRRRALDEAPRCQPQPRPHDPAPGAYDDYYIASTLRSESSTLRLDQTILFTTRDAPEHDALEKAISRTHQIDHWLASDFVEAIMFDEGDAVQRAAGHESKCRAHDNLNAIPHAASVADKAAA